MRRKILSFLIIIFYGVLNVEAQPFSYFPEAIPFSDGLMPNRIHVAYDCHRTSYVNERNGLLAGIRDSGNLPPGHVNDRSCKAGFTQNFDQDRRLPNQRFTGVVFNPVPGPPLGNNPRIKFKYFFQRLQNAGPPSEETTSMIIQLFNLSRGGHRGVVLRNLKEGEWTEAVVDMSKALRPAAGGGEEGTFVDDDRIDDIQFYVDPRSISDPDPAKTTARVQLWIDDMVLYDAAPQNESRPFPKDIIYTGWFDTGSTDQTVWPGDFKVIEHPMSVDGWDHVKSIISPTLGVPWIRVNLRGNMLLRDAKQLLFRYHSTTPTVKVVLRNRNNNEEYSITAEGLTVSPAITDLTPVSVWTQLKLDFSLPTVKNLAGLPIQPDTIITDIEFYPLLINGVTPELRIDDIWLHEAGLERLEPVSPTPAPTPLSQDLCPDDLEKETPGLCGCGISDSDSDGDTLPDCEDLCPFNSALNNPDIDHKKIIELNKQKKAVRKKLAIKKSNNADEASIYRLKKQLLKIRAKLQIANTASCA